MLTYWSGDLKTIGLRLGAIVIQMKFDVIMDLLKRGKLNRFTPDD